MKAHEATGTCAQVGQTPQSAHLAASAHSLRLFGFTSVIRIARPCERLTSHCLSAAKDQSRSGLSSQSRTPAFFNENLLEGRPRVV